ncbi:hypothetical protein NitYY0826_C0102 [Nitratiruptor sp. YY08-26]|uniref:hypothetical protein n=1 Tax=unclassified Nitratiruptor TaxID=2624044 RepID=UPI0019161BB5|nr:MULTISPECIES: hypothetical protein [unclassified Nitratiruptor]BCD61268.1 hypothetical protein NitYY0813_C0102 [Nitratiruptor sp. YY08-13]BCD65201.1 hypothetical protein NitYY0826_C0102 [Nitratiruptor sp. YY08-26]
MKKLAWYLSLGLTVMLLSGCGIAAAKKRIPKLEKPKQEVTTNETKYSVSLQTIGDMLYEIEDPDIYIYIQPITNKTTGIGKVPEDIAGMLKSSFMNMGYKVHVVSNPDFIPKGAEAFVIEGEISEFDAIKSENANYNLGLYFGKGQGETDISKQADYGYQEIKLGVDLRAINLNTLEYVPFAFAKNKVIIKRLTDSNEVGFNIAGSGYALTGSASVQNGVHESLRLLAEASSVELLGKLRLLPYWLAIPGAMPEYQVINNYKRKFRSLPPEKKAIYVYYLLGKFYPDMNENNFYNYIIRFKKEYGIYPPDDTITPELFVKLLINLPNTQVKRKIEYKRKKLLKSILE